MNALPEDPDVVLPDETPSPDEAPEPEPEPTPEPEPDPEPEPEPEPTPEPAPPTEKEIEALHKKLEAEAKRHAARIGDIMGDDATALVVCELCDANTPGFHWPADVYPDDDPRLYVLRLLQGDTGEEMRHPDYFQTCDECNGYGMVLTGARTDMTRQIACPVCEMSGYIDTRRAPAAVVQLPASEGHGSEQAANPSDDVQRDLAGRPDGHPRFWKLNNFLTPSEWQADKAAGFDVGDEFIGVRE